MQHDVCSTEHENAYRGYSLHFSIRTGHGMTESNEFRHVQALEAGMVAQEQKGFEGAVCLRYG